LTALASGLVASRAALCLGSREARAGARGEALEVLASRARPRVALAPASAVRPDGPDLTAHDVLQRANVLVAHGCSGGGPGTDNAMALAMGIECDGSATLNNG
jgi:hypothetical protein